MSWCSAWSIGLLCPNELKDFEYYVSNEVQNDHNLTEEPESIQASSVI